MATLDDLIDELDRFSEQLDTAAAEAVNHGAFVFKKHLQTGISSQLGSDMEFSEGGGIPVSVRYGLDGQGPTFTATIYPIGPAHWLRRIKPHDIAPRNRKGVQFPDGAVRGRAGFGQQARKVAVRHPGVQRDRSTWDRDKQRAAPEAARVMAQYFQDLVGGSDGAG